VSDINTAMVDSLKVLDPKWPIREADIRSRTKISDFALGLPCKLGFVRCGEVQGLPILLADQTVAASAAIWTDGAS
jgi:hypothetical protein